MHRENMMELVKALPMVEFCRFHGIGKTTAYKLMNEKRIVTTLVGRRRYVTRASVYALFNGPDPSSPVPK